MKMLYALAFVLSTGCAGQPRLVAPLRYEDPAVAVLPKDAAPELAPSAPELASDRVTCPAVRVETLPNGMRLAVAERHSFPSVSATLAFARDAFAIGDGHRLDLLAATFLSPLEGGEDAAAQCNRAGCAIGAGGTADELDSVIQRLAALVVSPHAPTQADARRLDSAEKNFRASGSGPWPSLQRNAAVLAFGRSPYGEPATLPSPPTLADLERVRETVVAPGNATLVVAGDVSFEGVQASVSRYFGGWAATPVADVARPDIPAASGPRLVLVENNVTVQALGAVVARGPAWGSNAGPAFAVAAQILGGEFVSSAYRAVREDLTASYAIGARLTWLPAASMLVLGGQLEEDKTSDALQALLGAMRRLREAGPPKGAVAGAKATLRGLWRHRNGANRSIAVAIADAALGGLSLDLCEGEARLELVSDAAVRDVARQYFAAADLGVVAVGPADTLDFLPGALRIDEVRRDGFGRAR